MKTSPLLLNLIAWIAATTGNYELSADNTTSAKDSELSHGSASTTP